MSSSRNWCFTLNNYTAEDEARLASLSCKYIVYGREVGESGTPHLQGYVEFNKGRKFEKVKSLLGDSVHLEMRRGTSKEASDYCKKDGNFFEQGVISKSADGGDEKKRWEDARVAAMEGRFNDIPADLYCRYMGNFKKIRLDSTQSSAILDGALVNEWFVGPSGTGKSKTAREQNPGAFDKDPKERWWDGYNGEDVVLIDDFDKFQKAQGGDLKRWSDRYPFPAAIKGGYLKIRPKKIVVTSQYLPEDIWDDKETLEAINRRFKIVHFSQFNPWNPPR